MDHHPTRGAVLFHTLAWRGRAPRPAARLRAVGRATILAVIHLVLWSHVWSGLELLVWPSRARLESQQNEGVSAIATAEAVVRVYAARGPLTGIAAVHCWIALKRADDAHYDRYEVGTVGLRHSRRPADGDWESPAAWLLLERRGTPAATLIPSLERAIRAYPHQDGTAYRLWPGPNSNTFIAYLGRAVPALRLELPPTAIGKDYLVPRRLVDRTPSGTGYQVSLLGVIGGSVGVSDGLELNVLGMTIGLDPIDGAIKLPGVGERRLFERGPAR